MESTVPFFFSQEIRVQGKSPASAQALGLSTLQFIADFAHFSQVNVLLPGGVSRFQEDSNMKKFIYSSLIVGMLLSCEPAFSQVSFGLRIGPPPPPPVVRVIPRRPGPNYIWINGYWYPHGNRYKWRNGYWDRQPYPGARWVAPRYDRQVYMEGYWTGNRDHRR